MSRFEVQTFKAGDYPDAVGTTYHWMTDPLAIGHEFERGGPAYTGRVDGRIAVVAGVMIPWPGLGHCWAHVTDVGREHGGFVHGAVVRHLRAIISDYRLIRLNADVVAGFLAARQWVDRMGFVLEADMPSYGPQGEDFVRYRWLR